MGWLKRYIRYCSYRIYAAGRLLAEEKEKQALSGHLRMGAGSVCHPRSRIMNFSGNPENIVLGKNCHIYGLLQVYPTGGRIQMGDHCSVGEYSRLVAGESITIGDRVMIAHNVNILDNNSHPKDAALRHDDFLQTYAGRQGALDLRARPVVIESDVWIGFNATVLKGVRIGRGAIIGAGAMVTGDVSPWTVNIGNPLRCIERLEPKTGD